MAHDEFDCGRNAMIDLSATSNIRLVTEPMLLHADLRNDPRMVNARREIERLQEVERRLMDHVRIADGTINWLGRELDGARAEITRLRARGQEPEPEVVGHDWTRAHREGG